MINNCKEIRVPIEIMKVRNLTITQKVLLSQIAGLDNKEGCFATNSYFAELFNLSKTQISSLISDLKEKGWINIKYVYKENTKCIEKRIIKVNCPPYPIILKEGIKANNNTPVKYDVKIELKRIGNNLNQLTRLCNEGKINAIGLEDLKSEVSKIWQLLNLLTQKLH